jgi:hypothetical protein
MSGHIYIPSDTEAGPQSELESETSFASRIWMTPFWSPFEVGDSDNNSDDNIWGWTNIATGRVRGQHLSLHRMGQQRLLTAVLSTIQPVLVIHVCLLSWIAENRGLGSKKAPLASHSFRSSELLLNCCLLDIHIHVCSSRSSDPFISIITFIVIITI